MDDSRSRLNRRELLRHSARAAALLSAGPVLAACGGASRTTSRASVGGTNGATALTPGPPAGGAPVRGGTLTVGRISNGTGETIFPWKAGQANDATRVYNLYDPLFYPVPGGTEPALATGASFSKDARLWKLKLRDGVTWHDGTPLTADDVVYTIRAYGSKQSNYRGQALALIDLKNVRKIDRLTVEVPLRRPFAALPSFLAFYNALVVKEGALTTQKPIGTGPFQYQSFTPGSRSVFTAYEHYWQGRPNLDQLVIDTTFTDDGSRMNALLGGEIDIAPAVPPALAKANASSSRVVIGNAAGPGFLCACMRVDVAPFNDPRVVQAFKLAMDRSAVVESVFDGYATIGNDAPCKTFQYWASEITPEHDPEKARSLLKAAGHENLTMPLYTGEVLSGINEMATVISNQLAGIGVQAPLKVLPPTAYFSAAPAYGTKARVFSMSYWVTIPPSLGGFYLSALAPGAEFDETGWADRPGGGQLLGPALAETDPAKAARKWLDVQEQQVRQGGYIVPANMNFVDAYAPRVRGVETTAAGNNAVYRYHEGWLAA